MIKRFVFMGESAGNTIWYDRKLKIPVQSPKSVLLDMEKTKNNYKSAAIGAASLGLIGSILTIVFRNDLFGAPTYTMAHQIAFIIINLLCLIIIPIFLHKVLYKNVKKAVPSNMKHLQYAIKHNNLVKTVEVKNGKCSWGNIAFLSFLYLATFGFGIEVSLDFFTLILNDKFIGMIIKPKEFGIYMGWGLILGVFISLICTQNIWLWIDIVKKVQKGLIKEEDVKDE